MEEFDNNINIYRNINYIQIKFNVNTEYFL